MSGVRFLRRAAGQRISAPRSVALVLSVLCLAGLPVTSRAESAAQGWPTYGGTYANTRHSDLDQITPGNVTSLTLAWRFTTGIYGQFETSPIVVGETLYFTTGLANMVIALDAATGKLKWRFTPKVGSAPYVAQVNRGVAVSGGRVFMATLDDQLIAIDARTGKQLWNVRIGDPRTGLSETMAPLTWKGLVFIGSSGGEYGIRGSFTAYSQADGHLVWRWWSVSQGWEGHYTASINGISLHRDVARERALTRRYRDAWRHGGGPIWMTPALDDSDGMIYLSTGNPAPNYNGDMRPGDNLYTDSIVALDARSGRMKWYFQETPHDLWDYDAASPPVLFDTVDGSGRRVPAVGEAGKTGWLYIVDRRSGKLIRISQSFVPQPYLYYPPSPKGQREEPGSVGGAIGPAAYDPVARAIFVGGIVNGEVLQKRPVRPWSGIAQEWQFADQSWDATGSSLFSRIDVDTGRVIWQHNSKGFAVGGALSAGGLVFTGEWSTGIFTAFDAKSGRVLWHVRPVETSLPAASPVSTMAQWWSNLITIGARVWARLSHQDAPPSDEDIHAPPIAYAVHGKEYIVIASDSYYSSRDVNGGDALYAFALPER